MNKKLIEAFTKRTSIRKYDEYNFSEEEISQIKEIINNSPTSSNFQQFSAVVITDTDKRKRISENHFSSQKQIWESSAFIVFFADRSRIKELTKDIKVSKFAAMYEFQKSIMDATIAAAHIQDALLVQGFGTNFIGGAWGLKKELIKELKAPKDSFPVVALCVGKYSFENDHKVKINKVFINEFNEEENIEETHNYVEKTKKYYKQRGMETDYEIRVRNYFNNGWGKTAAPIVGPEIEKEFKKWVD